MLGRQTLSVSTAGVARADDREQPGRGWDASGPPKAADDAATQLAGEISELPALPVAVLQVIRLTQDASATPARVERAIIADQALTAKVLKAANSAYYGIPRRVTSVGDAVTLLGMRAIRSMAMTISTVDLYKGGDPRTIQHRQILWKQSARCAVVSKVLARWVRHPDADGAFVAGLLHDMGKLVMLHRVPEAYLQIWDAVRNEACPQLEAERAVLGCDHCALGARVAESWDLPPELALAVQFHHCPELAPRDHKFLPNVLHVANVLTWFQLTESEQEVDRFEVGADRRAFKTLNRSLACLGLTMQDTPALLERCEEACLELESLFASS